MSDNNAKPDWKLASRGMEGQLRFIHESWIPAIPAGMTSAF
ncbi:MAG: hypothetical protein Q7V32_00995 [Methylicorpusculum sp.]|nr:hypothetical protein [Methylicorpusculum sp.]